MIKSLIPFRNGRCRCQIAAGNENQDRIQVVVLAPGSICFEGIPPYYLLPVVQDPFPLASCSKSDDHRVSSRAFHVPLGPCCDRKETPNTEATGRCSRVWKQQSVWSHRHKFGVLYPRARILALRGADAGMPGQRGGKEGKKTMLACSWTCSPYKPCSAASPQSCRSGLVHAALCELGTSSRTQRRGQSGRRALQHGACAQRSHLAATRKRGAAVCLP
jgi:hypothetical protein